MIDKYFNIDKFQAVSSNCVQNFSSFDPIVFETDLKSIVLDKKFII